MASKGNFENRLISAAGEETLKKAKALLKSGALVGAWRDRQGMIAGVFCENGLPRTLVRVRPGDEMHGECPLCPEPLCRHAVALIMHAGRFPLGEKSEAEPFYYGGLRSQPLGELIRRGSGSGAELTLLAQSSNPHVPSKWENIGLRVRLCDAGRECAGNLNNVRNLYFDKSVNVVIRYGDFSLQEQQIIRFLALYGEPDGAGIALDSELTAELFHSLVGFPRFFRDGKPISVRGERAEPALLDTGKKLIPGMLIEGRPLPAPGAKIVAGRSGCWIGCGQDYFFIPGRCEVGFMRSFFRSRELDRAEAARYGGLDGFQLPVIRADGFAVRERHPKVLIDGGLAEGKLELAWSFVYPGRRFGGEYAPGSGTTEVTGGTVWRRDTVTERRFAAALGLFGFSCREGAASLDGEAKIALFMDEVLPELWRSFDLAVGNGLADYANGLPKVRIVCSYLGSEPDAGRHRIDCRIGDGSVPWESAVSAALGGAGMLVYAGRFFKLDEAASRFLQGASRVLKPSGDGAFFLAFRDTAYFNALAADVPGARLPELFRDLGVSVPAKPPRLAFTGVLRGYQREGVEFMQFLTDRGFGALLADEMGLGKTVQLLAFFASRYGADDPPGLVVCPASLVVNWKNEAERFLPGVRAGILRSSGRKELADLLENSDLVIISYAAARLNSAMLRKRRFSTLILDEAQHIKNPGSGNARICKDLAASRRIVLSGTPLENSPEDLWSIMDFLQPGMLGTLPEFRRTYGGIGAGDDALRNDLAARVGPFIKRRTKLKVAPDLPARSELTLYCELAPEQRKLYDDTLLRGRELIRRGDRDRNGAAIFEVLLRLRQICCSPRLLPGKIGEHIPSAKGELLTELLHENIDSGHKMLLFSQFTSMLQLLTPELDAAGIVYEYLDGATRDRQKRVDRFNRDDAVRLFLLSLKAGGTGLNLTAADTVIIYDPWWNPAVESQAADRTHRIGQTKPVNILKLVVKDTIEEKVQLLQEHKRRIFADVVADPAAAGGFTLEELAMLFD